MITMTKHRGKKEFLSNALSKRFRKTLNNGFTEPLSYSYLLSVQWQALQTVARSSYQFPLSPQKSLCKTLRNEPS